MSFEGPLSPLLRPAALVFGLAVRLRNRRYDRGRAARSELPVVSVGNLTVGGTGKTPVVGWIAARLRDRGKRVAILSRGYRGSAGAGPLVVSHGDGALVEAADAGDEPFLLARDLHGVIVIAGADRLAGARAAARLGADVALLDDGFQHRRLARDLDVVLLDAARPFGNGWLLPAGPLREPPGSLRRAGAILLMRSGAAPIERALARHCRPDVPILRCTTRPAGFVDREGRPRPALARAVAFCGIANPARFFDDLATAGVTVESSRAFRDHHAFARSELEALRREAGERGADLVTTEKDLVRIRDEASGGIVALRVAVDIEDPGRLLDAVDRAIGGR